MKTVTLKMTDLLTNEKVERTICATNAYVSGADCYELGNKESQESRLNNWISERGNSQHETILELNNWKFSN